MPHPHKALLDEFQFATKHLPPTVPKEIVDEANKLHAELMENTEATEGQIHDALALTGKKEYPYRRAYQEMVGKASDEKLTEMVLDHVEPDVKARLEKIFKDGVPLETLVKSDMFENDFTGEERYQVTDGIMDALDHIREDLPKVIEARQAEYDKLVEKWKGERTKMEAKIAELRELAKKDEKWKAEIIDKANMFDEGFSVVERDASMDEIEKELEYWRGTLFEDEE